MGLGSLLGGFAKGYLQERGIQGTIEDVTDLAKGVSDLFASKGDDGDEFFDTYNSLFENEEYDEAIKFVNSYFRDNDLTRDEVYFYLMAQIHNGKAVDNHSLEEEQQAQSYITKAYNKCPIGNSIYNDIKSLQKTIRENIQFFKDEEAEREQYGKEWGELCDKFDPSNDIPAKDALKALDTFYKSKEENKDFYYYKLKFEGYRNLIYQSSPTEAEAFIAFLQENIPILKTLKGQVESLVDKNDEDQMETLTSEEEIITFFHNQYLAKRAHVLTDKGSFNDAVAIAKQIEADECDFNQVMSRIESLRLLDMVTNSNPTEDEVKPQLIKTEDFMNRACALEPDAETSMKIRTAVQERIDKAKQYLNKLQTLSSSHPTTASKSPSDDEAEYIEELKACYNDGEITDRERRLLDKLRKSLGISEARAAELEALCNPATLTSDEQEYADEIKACLEDDGTISERERRILNRLRKSLGISEERAEQIERQIK